MSVNSVTPIQKSVGYRAKSISIQVDGSIIAVFEVGTITVTGEGEAASSTFRPIAEKNYVLDSATAASVLSAETEGGTVHAELSEKLAAVLSQRSDWIV